MNTSPSVTSDISEDDQVKKFVSDFFNDYYTVRDCDKVIGYFDENCLFVCLSDDEIARGHEGCRKIIQAQMTAVPKPIPYFLNEYVQRQCSPETWNVFAHVDLNVVSTEWGTTKYTIRITLTVYRVNGELKITTAHVSEPGSFNNDKQKFGRTSESAHRASQREIGRIMSQVVPGGIVSRVVNPGSPISIANGEYLRMLGYATFYDFMEDCGGLFENSIHPFDLDKYREHLKRILTTDSQSECEYRVRCSSGSYLWVHDTGRKAISTDGRDLVVSILTDMSTQIERQIQLEIETETDALTSIYNRRGAIRRFRRLESTLRSYAVLILDIDNFKLVNDLYGHKQGDISLVLVAKLLKDHFGKTGIVCRLGGDEFSVFVPDTPDVKELEHALGEIISAFREHADREYPGANCSLSAGGVYGTMPMDFSSVFDHADANLYTVKRRSKDSFLLTSMPKD